MANRTITAAVSGETIRLSNRTAGAAGSYNAVSLVFSFDSAWDGTTKKVYFFDTYGENAVYVLLTSELYDSETDTYTVPIPAEPLAYPSEMTITVRGIELDGETAERIIMSASTTMKVLSAIVPASDVAPVEPTPTQAEQLLASINSVTGMTVSAETLDDGASATVTKTTNEDDTINLGFGIPKGDTGTAATIEVGTVSTGADGTSASITNSGTTGAAVFDFTIPKGDKGDAATIEVGTVTTGDAGTSATVTNSGTTAAAVFDFAIPQGVKGDTGTAATVAVGTVTTGEAGTDASVTNSGTSADAVFDFSIPKGDKGDTGNSIEYTWDGTELGIRVGGDAEYVYVDLKGDTGETGDTGNTGNGIASVELTSGNHAAGTTDTYTITFTDATTTTFTVYNGANGEGSGDMLASVYDPNAKNADAFSMANMVEGTTNKIFTSTERTKLNGVAAGAEVNVNADWNASSGDAQILNKPTIPTALSSLTDDSTHRLVTDTEKSTWNGKAAVGSTTPSTQAFGDSAAGGSSAEAARVDHKHAMPATTKDKTAAIGILKGNGTSVSAAARGTDYSLVNTPITVTFTSAGWTLNATTGAYEQSVACAGLLTTDDKRTRVTSVGDASDPDAQALTDEAYGMIDYVGCTTDGYLYARCPDGAPEVAFSADVIIMR